MQPAMSHIASLRMKQNFLSAQSNKEDKENGDDLVAISFIKPYETPQLEESVSTDEIFYYVPEGNKHAIWGSAFAQIASQDAISTNPAYDYNTKGAMIGLDFIGNPDAVMGLGIGGSYLDLKQGRHSGSAEAPIAFGSLYGSFDFNRFYLEPALLGSYTYLKNKRDIAFPGFSGSAKATIPSWQCVPHLGMGYAIELESTSANHLLFIEPYAVADWAISFQEKYTEKGATPFNFTQKAQVASLLRSEGGFKLLKEIITDWGVVVMQAKGSYVNKTPFWASTATVAVIGAPSFISLETFQGMQQLGSAGASILINWGKGNVFNISYQGEFGSGYMSNEVYAKISREF